MVQHVVSFIGFLIAVFLHIPSNALNARYTSPILNLANALSDCGARIFLYLGIGFFVLDRLVRFSRSILNNRKPGRATLTSLPGNVTRVAVQSATIKKWKPGQHVFLSIPRFGVNQSHPATIASIPSSHNNELVFVLRAHKGFTKRILTNATSPSTESLLSKTENDISHADIQKFVALIDGPYGASYSDFAAFDTTVLIAGSTGVTFTLPIMLDIAHRASSEDRLPVRRLVFVWMIKSPDWATWIVNELQKAVENLDSVGVEVEVKIFVTCDASFTEQSEDLRKCGCDCDVRLGPCCCCETSLKSDVEVTALPNEATKTDETSDTKSRSSAIMSEKTDSSISSPIRKPIQSSGLDSKTIPKSGEPLRDRLLQFATLQSGRPNLKTLLWEELDQAQGETGVAVCGPAGLSSTVRNTVARVSEQRGVAKGTGAGGVYMHLECYYW